MGKRVGLVDLGSNTIRLLVVEIEKKKLSPLRRELLEVRLGQGLISGGKLSNQAKEKAARGLTYLFSIMEQEKVEKGLVLATSAVREAADGKEFLSHLSLFSPYPLKLISPKEEAYYGFYGAAASLRGKVGGPEKLLVVDLGGRSTEFSWLEKGKFCYHSFPFGAVSLFEKHLSLSESSEGAAGVKEEVKRMLKRTLHIKSLREKELIGLGGTVTTLAALFLGQERYIPEEVNGCLISLEEIRNWEKRLLENSLKKRRCLLSFAPGRADILPAGTSALVTIMEFLNKERLLVSEEGILLGAAELLF